MDILGRIDHTIEDWERRPDAMRWCADGDSETTPTTADLIVGPGEIFFTAAPGPQGSVSLSLAEAEAGEWQSLGILHSEPIPAPPPTPTMPAWLHMASCPLCDYTGGEITRRVFATPDECREGMQAHAAETGHGTWTTVSVRSDAISWETS